jgi:hypothetical protein
LRCRSYSRLYRLRGRRIRQFDPGQTADQGSSLPRGGGPAHCRASPIEKNRKLAKLREPSSLISKSLRGVGTLITPQVEQQRRRLMRRTRSIRHGSRSRTTPKFMSARYWTSLNARSLLQTSIRRSDRLSVVAQGVVHRRREVVWCKGRTIGIGIAAATSKTEWPHALPIELFSRFPTIVGKTFDMQPRSAAPRGDH